MPIVIPSRSDLFDLGLQHISRWCTSNDVVMPMVIQSDEPCLYSTCAFYRNGIIKIHVPSCANIGLSGRRWSYPGYVVDRTPYGVLAHELAHHVDGAHGAAGGMVASQWRSETQETPITGYCDNDNEWFAEIFRLFVTNPDLLSQMRPRVFDLLIGKWSVRAETRLWREILGSSTRHMNAAYNKIK